ncbi:MAG: hypothetical protein HY819_12890 [Acidobacteria bacterium]|nr:hypothetical protein [Acidobacteriota bacterium]
MGLFGTKKIFCPKNTWTTLISNFAAGMPASWTITFKTENNEELCGEFEEKRYVLVFPQTSVRGQLQARMVFERYWINAIYSVKVYPKVDVTAEID